MDRRAFIAGMAGGLLGAPLVAEAQAAGKVPRIGYLAAGSPMSGGPYRKAFGKGLRDLGWIEGQNLLVEERWAEGNYDRLPGLAAELVRRKVDVIVASGASAVVRAAQQATSTIPIVMTIGLDPVGQGFIPSVRRPGGNLTGMAWDSDPAIAGKHLEFLRDMIPGLRRVSVLIDRAEAPDVYRKVTEQAAVKLGLTLQYAEIEASSEIEKAFALITSRGAQAVLVYGSARFFLHRRQIAALAAKHKLPDIYMLREHVEAGGLMSYGPSLAGLFTRAASYVDKILKGAKPADLPVEQPMKFELMVNLKTAEALGLMIPQSVLIRANELIQ